MASLIVFFTIAALTWFFTVDLVQVRGPEGMPWWQQAVLFTILLLGMAAKNVWDAIEVRREQNAQRGLRRRPARIRFDFWGFVQPMLIAAIIFEVVAGATQQFGRTAMIFSFQNGFFWQTIFRRTENRTTADDV